MLVLYVLYVLIRESSILMFEQRIRVRWEGFWRAEIRIVSFPFDRRAEADLDRKN